MAPLFSKLKIKRGNNMGQYFVVANVTKKEMLHPHKFGSGLKFLEFTLDGFSVMSGLAHLLAKSTDGVTAFDNDEITGRWIGDHIEIVGDYDESDLYGVASNEYDDISKEVIQHMGNDSYVRSVLSDRNILGQKDAPVLSPDMEVIS